MTKRVVVGSIPDVQQIDVWPLAPEHEAVGVQITSLKETPQRHDRAEVILPLSKAKELLANLTAAIAATDVKVTSFGIGQAVKEMQQGNQVRRAGWNGKGMWLALQVPDEHSKMTEPYVYIKTAQGGLIPWPCSQADLLATDWELAGSLAPGRPPQPSPDHVWDDLAKTWVQPGVGRGQAITYSGVGA